MKSVIFFLVSIILLAYSPLKAQNSSDLLSQHIEQISSTLTAAEALSDMDSRNPMIFPPGKSGTVARDAITAFWKGVLEMGISSITLESVKVYNYGNKVIEVGKYSIRSKKGNRSQQGNFRIVWKQKNNRWVLQSERWNPKISEYSTSH